ncbi:MAG: DUF6468 domain-containing protein [Pseudomonadota bacterium]
MDLLADILLIAGASGAALYCIVLSRRLSRFTNLENGVGGAIAALSTQVDDMTKALEDARSATKTSASSLETMTGRAEGVAQRLELLVASMHDLPVDSEKYGISSTEQAEVIGLDKTVFQTRRTTPEAAE